MFKYLSELWWNLNVDQRQHIHKLLDKLAIGALLPVIVKLISSENISINDAVTIVILVICAIILEALAILSLATGGQK